ncbi:type II secretion system minor pseudopilin GspJ [Ectopseudomonas mendocina]|uniref:Type II secretion system protein J n=1 Tax=Ectopseudomonas mendocina TaxID=300 RepID=A0ABZ2RGC5_ECTME
MKQRGFTLLEVLITITIFAMLALATWQMLDRVMRSDKRLDQHETQMRRLQRAMSILERDLVQARHLPLADDPSHSQAMVSQPDGLTLVRGGWRNPLDTPRSELLQVSHRWQNGVWVRESKAMTPTPDAANTGNVQQLMQNVELKSLRFVDGAGQFHDFWPAGSDRLTLPSAFELRLNTPGYPGIRRFILLPGDRTPAEVDDE